MTSPTDAFRRAARFNPACRTFGLYANTLDTKDRPTAAVLDWLADARGVLRWRDVDRDGDRGVQGPGDGVLTLYTDFPTVPNAVQDVDGSWLEVVSGLERDALGAGLRLAVRRRNGCAPSIRVSPP